MSYPILWLGIRNMYVPHIPFSSALLSIVLLPLFSLRYVSRFDNLYVYYYDKESSQNQWKDAFYYNHHILTILIILFVSDLVEYNCVLPHSTFYHSTCNTYLLSCVVCVFMLKNSLRIICPICHLDSVSCPLLNIITLVPISLVSTRWKGLLSWPMHHL